MSEDNKHPKKIGYVLKCYPRFSETFVVNEILAHEAAGLNVEIFSLMSPENGHYQDIIGHVKAPVQYLPDSYKQGVKLWDLLLESYDLFPDIFQKLPLLRNEKLRDINHALELAKLIRSHKIDHLHAHFASAATTVARLASFFSSVPYTFTAHAKDIFHEDTDYEILRSKLRDASGTVTVSDFNIDFLRKKFGPDSSKVQRVYNGLDLKNLLYKKPENRESLIITVGRLVEKKGINVLVDACKILSQRGCTFHCRIIGQGEFETKIRSQINDNGLEQTVELVGVLPRSEVVQNFYDAQVFVLPAIIGQDGNRDGLPTSILESMALGTPCISTDVTGIPEVVKQNETGLVVPQNDPVSLANALEKLLSDQKIGIKLSENARKLIESQFNITKNSADIRKIFEKNVISAEAMMAKDV